jgi:hypothetical protein
MVWCIVVATAAFGSPACNQQERRLQQHKEQFESLGSTTAAIGDAWLAGSVPGTYARAALEQTLRLSEQERTALAISPQSLVDPRGAQLSQAAERLSRLLAVMAEDVRAGDAPSARRHLTEIPIVPSEGR